MAYLGRQGVTAPLTSADIPDNSITTAKIVDDNVTAAKIPAGAVSSDVLYLENNTSTQTLSGTYSTERLYFNDDYQLTGDVTVNNHLALGSIADEDVVITQDSTERTITGEGTLDGGNVLQDTHRTSVTGMTGELGSAVTGSPNLNLTTGTLGSGVTFPSGHVIGVQHIVDASQNTTSSTSYAVACSSVAYTIKNASSTLWITGHFQLNFINSNAKIKSVWSTNDFTDVTTISESASWGIRNNNANLIDFIVPFSEKYTHGLAVGATIRFRIYANRQGGGGTTSLNAHDSARMTIMEVI